MDLDLLLIVQAVLTFAAAAEARLSWLSLGLSGSVYHQQQPASTQSQLRRDVADQQQSEYFGWHEQQQRNSSSSSAGGGGSQWQPSRALQTPAGCREFKTVLENRQLRICRLQNNAMASVAYGARLAIIECQWQFRRRRWNCTEIDPVNIYGAALREGTREAAFIHAIGAAGVAHRVTSDCSEGVLDECGCDMTKQGSWQKETTTSGRRRRQPQQQQSAAERAFRWAGCSDNVDYGTAFSRQFTDVAERKNKRLPIELRLANLHNYEAGRTALRQLVRRRCKCHGVSGSCEVRTCWMAMSDFRAVGDALKRKFDGATEVRLSSDEQQLAGRFAGGSSRGRRGGRRGGGGGGAGRRRRRGRRGRVSLVPVEQIYKRQTDADLVYLRPSPNFCQRNESQGLRGTHGRVCNATSYGIDGCELLCCSRGYTVQDVVEFRPCRCKFRWCCDVKCKRCKVRRRIHICN